MAVEYDDLKMSLSEYFELPLCVRSIIIENQKEITEAKTKRMSEISKT